MAESSLDDFFAKKDKTKKKKGKVNPNDLFSQTDSASKKSKKKKDKDGSQQNKEDEKKDEVDNDWIEFDDTDTKDYSDLRIATIDTINKDSVDGDGNKDDGRPEDEDANGEETAGPVGPWNITQEDAPTPQSGTPFIAPEPVEPEPQPAPEPVSEAPAAGGPRKYVPPALRNAGGAAAAAPLRTTPAGGRGRRSKAAPDIKSDEDFPSLGGPVTVSQGPFEDVKSGGRRVDDSQKDTQQLELGNKFNALTNAD